MSEKKIRFTFIDALVILVVIAVAAFVGVKFFGKNISGAASLENTYIVSYYFEEVPDFAADAISVGDPVSDETKKVGLGVITDVKKEESVYYAPASDGKMVKSPKEGYSSVTLTTEVSASEFDHGIKVAGNEYVVGHSITLYAGKGKIWGRVSGIEKK